MYKIGIIGAGAMGKLHAKLINASDKAKVTAVIDKFADSAKALADEVGAAPYTDFDEAIKHGLDMVFITLPNNFHAETSIKALNAGLHVFCEKPMATKTEDALKMLDSAKQNGKRIFIGLNRRFAPIYAGAKSAVSKDAFKPSSINMIQNDGDMAGSTFNIDFETLGGFLCDTTVHFLDLAEFFMGKVKNIRALSNRACYPVDDNFTIMLEFESKAAGVITSCGHGSWIFPFERVQIVGDHCAVITDELEQFRLCPGLNMTVESEVY
jgi:myo-inositol 2-dehydrogenase/D-chiro-inositol 1-dehydrogenase